MKLIFDFRIPFTTTYFKIGFLPILTLDNYTIGVNSNLGPIDGSERHIFMADYDDRLSDEELTRELKMLQERFGLGDLEIWESSHNKFFVYGFYERMSYDDFVVVTRHTSTDPQWKKWRMVRNCGTLRLSKKVGFKDSYVPKPFRTVKSPNRKRLHSDNKTIRDFVYSTCGEVLTNGNH